MKAVCCLCEKEKMCFAQAHIKIIKIKRLYIKLIGNVPAGHETLMYCGDCGDFIFNELQQEFKAIDLYKRGIQIPKNITTDNTNTLFTCEILDKIDSEYQKISSLFGQTMDNEIIRIEKCSNKILLQKFLNKQKQFSDEPSKYLFHGSCNQNYDNILSNGFDLSLARSSGSLGAGIYFAKNASYSDGFTSGISTKELGVIKNMLCCRVIFGKIGTDTRQSADIYAVFSEDQCYPEYIIYYCC